MSSLTALRAGAIGMAIVGLIDPSWTTGRRVPVAVDIKVDPTTRPAADDVRKRLISELGNDVSIDSIAEPSAVIMIGGVEPMRTVRDGVPVSTVSLSETPAPDIRIVAAPDPSPVPVGWAATFTATVEGRGLSGKTSRLVLEDGEPSSRTSSSSGRPTRSASRRACVTPRRLPERQSSAFARCQPMAKPSPPTMRQTFGWWPQAVSSRSSCTSRGPRGTQPSCAARSRKIQPSTCRRGPRPREASRSAPAMRRQHWRLKPSADSTSWLLALRKISGRPRSKRCARLRAGEVVALCSSPTSGRPAATLGCCR